MFPVAPVALLYLSSAFGSYCSVLPLWPWRYGLQANLFPLYALCPLGAVLLLGAILPPLCASFCPGCSVCLNFPREGILAAGALMLGGIPLYWSLHEAAGLLSLALGLIPLLIYQWSALWHRVAPSSRNRRDARIGARALLAAAFPLLAGTLGFLFSYLYVLPLQSFSTPDAPPTPFTALWLCGLVCAIPALLWALPCLKALLPALSALFSLLVLGGICFDQFNHFDQPWADAGLLLGIFPAVLGGVALLFLCAAGVRPRATQSQQNN